MATFGGVDLSINGAFAMKYNKAAYWEGGTNQKYDLWTTKKAVAAEDARLVAKIDDLATDLHQTAVNLTRTCGLIEDVTTALTQRVLTLETDAGTVNQRIGTLTTRVGNVEMQAGQINYISVTQIKLSALIINLN
jgi:hypothetical protein